MSLSLHTIKPHPKAKKDPKRVGRGLGSKGTYSGRGVKGQRARSGGRSGLKLRGFRKIMLSTPKMRGFKKMSEKVQILNVEDLNRICVDGTKVTPKLLLKKGLINHEQLPVKILSNGNLNKKIFVEGCRVSQAAKAKIEQAGGAIT